MRLPCIFGGNGDVIQKAETTGHIGIGMVARRSAQCVGLTLALEYQPGSGERTVGRAAGRRPGVLPERTGGIGHVPASAANNTLRVGGKGLRRVYIGNDFIGAVSQRLPVAAGGL